MSWIDKIETDFVITTGDGKEFRPMWMNASKGKEYNVAEFTFPDLPGSLVKRGTPRGNKYAIEIYFQGENHLEESLAFETSSNDSRAWIITHPFYGNITVHPTSLTFDNSAYNVSKITGTVIETIQEDVPRPGVVAEDKIAEDQEAAELQMAEDYVNNNPAPDASDIASLQANNTTLYESGASKVKSKAEAYFNLFNQANAAIVNATTEPLQAIRLTQTVLSYPARFSQSVRERLNILSTQFNALSATVSTLTTKAAKLLFENNAGTLISAMALTTSTPQDGDYTNRDEVLDIISLLLNDYDNYILNLNTLQSVNGGQPGSYIPSPKGVSALASLINFTVANLFIIALNARQERVVILEEDSNLILLAHRFYGLQSDDSTIKEMMNSNNIGLNEMLQIKKGRRLVYYV